MPNRPPRLEQVFQKYDPPLYFVTFNTDHRRHLLANERVHQRFIAFAETGLSRGTAIGRYVIMPDHIPFVRARQPGFRSRPMGAHFETELVGSNSRNDSALAIWFLRPSHSPQRKLRGKMGIRLSESGAGRVR